jgi:NADH-quinone oxidoreductase subunit A
MDREFIQILEIIVFVAAGFALPALGMIGLAWVLQKVFRYHAPNPIKNQPYECGMEPLQEARLQFDIRYYLYALLFIVFDIEIIFLIPWALATHDPDLLQNFGSMLAPIEITIFLGILAVGLAYAWKKGALKWE